MATNPIEVANDSPVTVRITLPGATIAKYEPQTRNATLEETMAERIIRCASYHDTKPLYFGDQDRAKLEGLLGKNLSSPKDALHLLQRSFSVRANNVQITFKPSLLARLKSRCFSKDFEKWLANLVTEELERYVGLR